ncbi:MAG: ATP-dependent DNA helicase, partial [Patescibacteria group bacterium]
ANNLTVVGDDDQSIYKFRGASVSNILKFQETYKKCRQITLTQNYRSFQNLLDLSYKFIQANNPDRLEVKLGLSKKLKAQRKGSGGIEFSQYPDYHSEADAVVRKISELKENSPDCTWNDFAILVRANESSETFVESLDRASLPYIHLSRRGLYKKSIIVDLLAYFRLLDNYHESAAMYRVLNFKKFSIPHDDLSKILDYARRKTCSLYEALSRTVLVNSLSDEAKKSAREFLKILEKHTVFSKNKSVVELFPQIVADLALVKGPSEELSPIEAQNADLLDQFSRRIKDFSAGSEQRSLRDFMDAIELELSAGEQGSLDFDPDIGPEAIKIITVHSAKGLEFRYVFLPALADKKFPAIGRSDPVELPEKLIKDILPSGDFHIQEERRLFYVAMTRARDALYFSFAQDYGGSSVRKPSIFLRELNLSLKLESRPTGEVVFNSKINKTKPRPPFLKTFSYTSISAFRSCPLEYKFQYILKVPQAGAAPLSFGQTIHKTLENYLRFYSQENQISQGDLFTKSATKKSGLPSLTVLLDYYKNCWVDDWYEDKAQKEAYRKQGVDVLKMLFETFKKTNPAPKYLEKNFKLGLDKYILTGKIDRADATGKGLVIIDYKTGGDRPLEKVDREQLLIYQWAARDFLREKVAELQYWYLKNGLNIKSFLGTDTQIEDLKTGLLETIEQIADAVQNDNFLKYHRKHQNCKFEA